MPRIDPLTIHADLDGTQNPELHQASLSATQAEQPAPSPARKSMTYPAAPCQARGRGILHIYSTSTAQDEISRRKTSRARKNGRRIISLAPIALLSPKKRSQIAIRIHQREDVNILLARLGQIRLVSQAIYAPGARVLLATLVLPPA